MKRWIAGMLLMAAIQWLPEKKGTLQKSLLWRRSFRQRKSALPRMK